MTSLQVRAPAKVNFCLRVLARRADGFHEIESVVHTIGLWDTVALEPVDEPGAVALRVASGEAPADDTNLCWRAAALLAERAKPKRGVAITLDKVIPERAGLGGASSDAAATLMGLQRLWDLSMPLEELESLAAEIGADVPFFLRGGCCLARGKGERLSEQPEIRAWLVLAAPQGRVSTRQAYSALNRGVTRGRQRKPSRPTQRVLDALREQDLGALARMLHNDFEKADISAIADALRAKQELVDAGCLGACLTGSGSAVFGIAPDRDEAERIAEGLRAEWPWVVVVATVPAGEAVTMISGEDR